MHLKAPVYAQVLTVPSGSITADIAAYCWDTHNRYSTHVLLTHKFQVEQSR